MCNCTSGNPEVPGSLVPLAPRDDVFNGCHVPRPQTSAAMPKWGWRPPQNWLVILRAVCVRGSEMTYCCGVLVRDGLVMIADTRTNAGLDNVSTFRKLHIFSKPGDRIMAIASAGNLAISQSVLSTLTEGLEDPHTGDIETLLNAPTMFQAAQRIGRAIRAVHATEGVALQSEDINFDVSFLFGGQIKGSRMRLFMVYPAGNFIECTTDTPYLQIGEHKYGKPVLDRAMHYDVDLYGLDDALQSRRRPADRRAGGAHRRLRRRSQSPHRGGRAVFSRSAVALVGGATRGASEYSKTTLQNRNRTKNVKKAGTKWPRQETRLQW